MVVPRSLLATGRQRKEVSRTGVYILVGPPEGSDLPRIYIGEGDPIRPRIDQHAINKDFWTVFIAFTSKDENLNKAHVQYLESRLVDLAKTAKRCVLENGNVPTLPSLSEADVADSEGFLDEILLCLPVLGQNMFTSPPILPAVTTMMFALRSKNAKARGMEAPEGFIVESGSVASPTEVPSCHAHLSSLRATLLSNGVLVPTLDGYTFTQDYVFTSPSNAAGVVLGRSANGRMEWKTNAGLTLKEIQESSLI